MNDAISRARAHEHKGEIDAARDIYKDVLQAFPGNWRARQALARIDGQSRRQVNQEPPQEVLDALLDLYRKGKTIALAEQTRKLVRRFATSVVLWNMLGISSAQLGDLAIAETAFRRASELNPDYAEAQNNLGNVLRDEGKITDAVASFRRAIELVPNYAEAHNNLGNALADQGELDEAAERYRRALSLKPDYVIAHINLGNILTLQGRAEEAVDRYRLALRISPDQVAALNGLGNALNDLGRTDEAIECYRRALEIAPDHALAHTNLGIAQSARGEFTEAGASYQRALAIKPDYAECLRLLSGLTTYKAGDPEIVTLQRLHEDDGTSVSDRCHLCFALAKAFEDTGDLSRAFGYLQQGNALRKGLLQYDITQDHRVFAAIRKADDAASAIKITRALPDGAPVPIFILGMPRSGTSLVEQILSSHSAVHGAGELATIERLGGDLIAGKTAPTAENLTRFGAGYLAEVTRRSEGKTFVSDKAPHNFQFIGLIARTLPDAKIIHVTRNAKAVCWSNFRQYFNTAGLGYAYDLNDVAEFYKLYEGLMTYWSVRLPDRVYTLDYDALTEDQEAETRKLIAHLGLTWEDACLSPHNNPRSVRTASDQQIRQEVYRGSSQAWKRYEPFIGGAFDAV